MTTAAPTATTTGYRDAYATIARQSSGLRMFAANDPLPDLTVSGLQATRDANGLVHVSAVAHNLGSTTASGVLVAFSDGTHAAFGTSTAVILAPGASRWVSVSWPAAKTGSEDVVAVIDPQNVIAESNEDNNKAARKLTIS